MRCVLENDCRVQSNAAKRNLRPTVDEEHGRISAVLHVDPNPTTLLSIQVYKPVQWLPLLSINQSKLAHTNEASVHGSNRIQVAYTATNRNFAKHRSRIDLCTIS
ncbi:hypothetical protein EUGRSUZ_K01659 [Eucalyptus grandis]|uniref:Uncharacterized protein n=2 Tax=Eucalyptus grandis TaxID=71139 RepID=A0ACC3IUV9_EUCGR|nr:hypothetical protein EUGRSUZ_K01659 [Eucalyptus grandis]